MPDPLGAALAIVDASLVIKAILPNPEATRCREVLNHLQGKQLVAPALWMYEITSTLAKAIHFEQLTDEEGQAALRQALALGVQMILPDDTQCQMAYDQTRKLKRASAYDSFYLVAANALNADFWTADRRLFRSFQGKHPQWLHCVDEIS